jgi:hypothetical protein
MSQTPSPVYHLGIVRHVWRTVEVISNAVATVGANHREPAQSRAHANHGITPMLGECTKLVGKQVLERIGSYGNLLAPKSCTRSKRERWRNHPGALSWHAAPNLQTPALGLTHPCARACLVITSPMSRYGVPGLQMAMALCRHCRAGQVCRASGTSWKMRQQRQ